MNSHIIEYVCERRTLLSRKKIFLGNFPWVDIESMCD